MTKTYLAVPNVPVAELEHGKLYLFLVDGKDHWVTAEWDARKFGFWHAGKFFEYDPAMTVLFNPS